MPAPLDPAKLSVTLVELGVTPHAIHAIRMAPFPKAVEMLKELKELAKRNYKRLAFELHPDRTGNDPDKSAKFAFVTTVWKEVEKMEVRQPPPPPQVFMQVAQVVHFGQQPPRVQRHGGWVRVAGTVNGSTASTATTTAFPRGVHVVFMRPG